jgi:hypothetical protein
MASSSHQLKKQYHIIFDLELWLFCATACANGIWFCRLFSTLVTALPPPEQFMSLCQ